MSNEEKILKMLENMQNQIDVMQADIKMIKGKNFVFLETLRELGNFAV